MKRKGIYMLVFLIGLLACIENIRKTAESYYEDYRLCYGLNGNSRNGVSDYFKYNISMNTVGWNGSINNAWNAEIIGTGWNGGMYGTGWNNDLHSYGWNSGFNNPGWNMSMNNFSWNGHLNNMGWSQSVIGTAWNGSMYGSGWNGSMYSTGWNGSMYGTGWNNGIYNSGFDFNLWSYGTSSTFLPVIDLIPTNHGDNSNQVKRAKWTFMVYLDADNNLEYFGIEDFLEMAEVENSDKINIIVQFDRLDGFDSRYDDWTTCKRFHVTQGMTPTSEEALEDLGEINMGSSDTLTDFINWSVEHYPARHYALVLWNHGDGWRRMKKSLETALKNIGNEYERDRIERTFMEKGKEPYPAYKGICTDDTNGKDFLLNKEVQEALLIADIVPALIGFDACLMGMIEVGYQISDTGAAVLVASEEVEPGPGWPYDTILGDLVLNPDMSPSVLGTLIVDRYFESYGNDMTLSAIDLTHMGALASKISDLAESIQIFWTDREQIRPFARMVMDEIEMAVIHNQHGSSWPGAYGLAIYFPEAGSEYDKDYNMGEIDFAADTSWDDFLTDFYTNMQSSWVSMAKQASQGFYINNHVDLYDFCLQLIAKPEEEYIETFIPKESN